MRVIAAWLFALALLAPVGIVFLGTSAALMAIDLVRWPLQAVREACLKFLRSVRR
jgi:hypothetical protein